MLVIYIFINNEEEKMCNIQADSEYDYVGWWKWNENFFVAFCLIFLICVLCQISWYLNVGWFIQIH